MNVLQIDGVTLPTPDRDMGYGEFDLQSEAYRDELGYTHKTTVRWGVKKLSPTWSFLTNAELSAIRSALKGKEYVTVTYYSDTDGSNGQFTAYSGDLEYQVSRILSANKAIYKGVKIDIIEA